MTAETLAIITVALTLPSALTALLCAADKALARTPRVERTLARIVDGKRDRR